MRNLQLMALGVWMQTRLDPTRHGGAADGAGHGASGNGDHPHQTSRYATTKTKEGMAPSIPHKT